MNLNRAHDLMNQALEERLFTGAVLLVNLWGEPVAHEAYGCRGPGTDAVTRDTLFDLASLTKVLATTPCWMLLAAESPGILERKLDTWIDDCPAHTAGITPRQLLAHASGLPAWRPYYLMRSDAPHPVTVRRLVIREPFQYAPGTGCVYSDLGFMLLAFIIEMHAGLDLAAYANERVYEPLGLTNDLLFTPRGQEMRTAWTRQGDPPGLVNDLNARALGGVAGHAGLFGTAAGVAALAEEYTRSLGSPHGFFERRCVEEFTTRAGFTADSTRALGFDTPSAQGSTSGKWFSSQSIGHTGFTGTSLWMDLHRKLTVVLLTNRVIVGEADQRIKDFRPRIHDAIVEEISSHKSFQVIPSIQDNG